MGKYLREGTGPETDNKAGGIGNWLWINNVAWKEIVTAHKEYRDKKKKELDAEPDATKMSEFKITEQIRSDILEERNTLNPSHTSNYGASPPPEGAAHLKK